MQRRTFILRVAAASIVAAVIPLAMAVSLAHRAAVDGSARELAMLAGSAVAEIERDIETMDRVLRGSIRGAPADCGPGHIAAMRDAAITEGLVLEIGYLQGTRVRCTAWGGRARLEELPDTHRLTAQGDRLWLTLNGTGGARYRALQRGDHYVLIPARMLAGTHTHDSPPDIGVFLHGETQPFAIGRSGRAPSPVGLPAGSGKDESGGLLRYQVASPRYDFFAVAQARRRSLAEVWSENGVWIALVGTFAGLLTGMGTAYALRRRLSLSAGLAEAIDRDELTVLYQPLVRLRDGACIGAEALVRWNTAEGEGISPEVFVPIAESSGLIQPLTEFVLRAVVTDLSGPLRTLGLPISINVAAASLHDDSLRLLAESLLAPRGLPRSLVSFECTERDFVAAPKVAGTVAALRDAGHRVVVDDFGTGYSGLSALQSLAVDAVKIDRVFIEAMGENSASMPLIRHMVAIARDLGVETVAEGVETEAQRRSLAALGVHSGQGFLFGRPMTAADLRAFAGAQPRHVPTGLVAAAAT
ncbi:MAG: EAL domain-containing protein [Alphaproteobacteria bacterium]|nr:EAL domain-containing protein [Alphaproteobacteria bacterium]